MYTAKIAGRKGRVIAKVARPKDEGRLEDQAEKELEAEFTVLRQARAPDPPNLNATSRQRCSSRRWLPLDPAGNGQERGLRARSPGGKGCVEGGWGVGFRTKKASRIPPGTELIIPWALALDPSPCCAPRPSPPFSLLCST